jgi:hypothetical protein
MGDGRSKNTQRGLGTPDSVDARSQLRAEQTVGHLLVVSPPNGTPIVVAASDAKSNARSEGTATAAAYVEPKTPPPVRAQRSDTVAVLLSDDIDPQKVPTEPSLSRRRELSQWSDISRLPQVKYKSGDGAWRWVLVAAFGGIVGYWVYWGASRGASHEPPTTSEQTNGKVVGAAKTASQALATGSTLVEIPVRTVASTPTSEKTVSASASSTVSAQPARAASENNAPAQLKSTSQAGRPMSKASEPKPVGAKVSEEKPADSKSAPPAKPKGSEVWLQ